MSEPIVITIDDERAWYYHAYLAGIMHYCEGHARTRAHVTSQGADRLHVDSLLGTATTTRADDKTTITIAPAAPEHIDTWHRIVRSIVAFANEADAQRRAMGDMTAEEIIERYYRAHVQNPKITLKMIAAQQNKYSYGYLREIKRQYDAAGKWGSKKRGVRSDDTGT